MNELNQALRKVDTQLGALELELDERLRLVLVLRLEPSANDNLDIISHVSRLAKQLSLLHDILVNGTNQAAITEFQARLDRYQRCFDRLQSDTYIDVSEYALHFDPFPEVTAVLASTPKTVRFQDDPDTMRSELMGTKAFKPYRDDEEASLGSFDPDTNQQLFAQHQQQILDQDLQLDTIHDSVRRQHAMGVSINDEVDDHLILLNDLELGVDASQIRLRRATDRLRKFRQACRENGSLVTIVVLTVTLILLLVVLN